MPKHHVLKHRDLIKKLKPLGIIELKRRGKGSERMLYRESTNDDYPITFHGKKQEHSVGMLKAIKRRFGLTDDDIWG